MGSSTQGVKLGRRKPREQTSDSRSGIRKIDLLSFGVLVAFALMSFIGIASDSALRMATVTMNQLRTIPAPDQGRPDFRWKDRQRRQTRERGLAIPRGPR